MTDIAGWKLTADLQGRPTLRWDERGLTGSFIVKAEIDTKALNDEEMVVSGFASVEEVDRQGDLITLEAFKTALKRLEADGETLSLNYGHTSAKIGTVRKMVFLEDSSPRKFWIEAKLKRESRLARAAYADVKAGKLKAFSIGGMALVPGIRWCETNGRCVNKIDDIELYEVSLVEEPANEKSLIMAIKSAFPEFTRTLYTKDQSGSVKKEEPALEASQESLEQRISDIEEVALGMLKVMRMQLSKEYGSVEECVADNQDKEDPDGFCAYLGRPGEKGKTEPIPDILERACSGKKRFPAFGRKSKGENLNKEGVPPTAPPTPPTPPQPSEVDTLKAKVEALEAEAKLHRMEREKAEKALEEAKKAASTAPTLPTPAPQTPTNPQPPSKGEHPSATPSSGEKPLSISELAHKLNEEGKPLSWGRKD